ncbi:fimbrillin family protein [uncultured Alistipes sp.]|uniref:fimbrillin family protein n=2 Tax=uncultured Alistipes sp. TaxID=538949 RepID=UPI002585F149|nr:fimbrillin family protein [uncultured Alistipes sp.]
MRIIKQLAILPTLAALAAAAVSCHDGADWLTPDTGRRIEVSINAPSTRTALCEDGLTARWIRGDRIALWAYAGGTAAFANVPFTLWYPREDPEQGLFTGEIDGMNAGTYDYYASYPTPEAAEGTKVSYTIPTVQDGTWNGDLDIMLAATQGAELKEEILNEITLRFHHKVHALKITIPEGRNLLGRPIEKLRIEFPQPVAGRMTWDLAHPEAAPETAATARAVTLDFATPVDEGDTFWVFIAPADLTGGQVRFTATDGTEYSWPLSAWNFRDCAAGRMTPVRLTIDQPRPQQAYKLTVDPTNLGEPVTEIDSLTMPAGYEFPTLELSATTRTITPNGDGTFSTRIFSDQANALGAGMQVAIGVGSENTAGVYGRKCEVTNATAEGCTVMAPYLFFEDFSEITSFNADADKGIGGAYAQSLADYNLEQWYAARAQGEAGQAIRICCNSNGMVYYPARIDTRPLSYIKPGRQISVRVLFNANANGAKAGDCRCNVGTSQGGGGFKGSDNLPNSIATLTIAERSNASFTEGIVDEYTFTVTDCAATTCLSWQYAKKNSTAWISGYTSMWMDNIRVTIAH